jgi:hypothetical protein
MRGFEKALLSWFVFDLCGKKLYVYMGRGKHMARRLSVVVWELGMNIERKEGA